MILIDPREGSADLLPYLKDIAEFSPLESGDIAIIGNGPDGSITVGVELKSVMDAVSSLETGRIGAQLRRMLSVYNHTILLIHGIHYRGMDGSLIRHRSGDQPVKVRLGKRIITWSFLESFLVTAQLKAGVHVTKVDDLNEASAYIRILYKWLERSWESHSGMVTIQSDAPVHLDLADNLVYKMANQLPGVGPGRAADAARRFKSVTEMVEADEKDWAEIPKIGPKTAAGIVRAVRE